MATAVRGWGIGVVGTCWVQVNGRRGSVADSQHGARSEARCLAEAAALVGERLGLIASAPWELRSTPCVRPAPSRARCSRRPTSIAPDEHRLRQASPPTSIAPDERRPRRPTSVVSDHRRASPPTTDEHRRQASPPTSVSTASPPH
ncbi:uncharacterized protein M421DRAFT_20 [Didymella exigua CBS 183.55]|uniref:Uncharacterized protein n=1 Tax=Didymella exigua CBS 183.55 TaxID=1150837 RepID=A0A6A5S243_9PLEO|nr:uncharacterized protein M421DRAFT_20 [Didymella exigua CBS 183.55]KAF1933819.1 hypothetical protein M421DRAFT_20 [Didymella exigua CBS 183.55]